MLMVQAEMLTYFVAVHVMFNEYLYDFDKYQYLIDGQKSVIICRPSHNMHKYHQNIQSGNFLISNHYS